MIGNIFLLTNKMEKTISLEASKELQDVMPEETEYVYEPGVDKKVWKWWVLTISFNWEFHRTESFNFDTVGSIKTLTLEEAIDRLPEMIWRYSLCMWKKDVSYYNYSWDFDPQELISYEQEALLQAVEKMLLYLHKKWLLTK